MVLYLQINDDYKLFILDLQNMVSPSAALIQFVAKKLYEKSFKKTSKWIQIKRNLYN